MGLAHPPLLFIPLTPVFNPRCSNILCCARSFCPSFVYLGVSKSDTPDPGAAAPQHPPPLPHHQASAQIHVFIAVLFKSYFEKGET